MSPGLQAAAEILVAEASGAWGVMAWSIDKNAPLISIDASNPRVPASNNKIFTAIWALDELGPGYRFPTDLLISGPFENGTLRGDVILRGSGNPAFGYPPRLGFSAFTDESMAPLRRWSGQARRDGRAGSRR